MSKYVNDDGVTVERKGREDVRTSVDTIHVASILEGQGPKRHSSGVKVSKVSGESGRPHRLFLSMDEAEALADALDTYLELMESYL